ncbi:MAG: hypothetical protein HY706_09765 [Candidatus Hydrogenedentes bacterium]|nr:hypothetical protein [Candidatus Hydrogenedentota bacterium]
MDGFDDEYLWLVTEPFIEIGPKGKGCFQFGVVEANMDVRVTERDSKPSIKFTWEGYDEGDEISGRGWAVLDGSNLHGSNGKQRRIVTVYPYHDENGNVLHEKVRTDPKGFYQRKPDGTKNGEGVPHVLYRLREVLKAVENGDRVHVCEGEKDADRLHELGLCGTTSAGTSPHSPSPKAFCAGLICARIYDLPLGGMRTRPAD